MFSDILKIVPQLDTAALRSLERKLQGRFTKIAKHFGRGLKNAMLGGGVVGLALGLVDKILNPLKEVQEAIDRSLKSSGDIANNAKQFNTDAGKLYKLIQLARGAGLDQENLFLLMSRFQNSVAEARNNPEAPGAAAVRNFVGEGDTAEGFFQFIQSLQKMDRDQQVLVQQAVFGERQILKMAAFLQQDFPKLFSDIGLDKVTSAKLANSIDKLDSLSALADVLAARRETDDMLAKGRVINESMIRSRDQSERLNLQRENQRIQSYKDLSAISDTGTKIMTLVEEGVQELGKGIRMITPKINQIVETLDRWSKSPMLRGLFKFGKDH